MAGRHERRNRWAWLLGAGTLVGAAAGGAVVDTVVSAGGEKLASLNDKPFTLLVEHAFDDDCTGYVLPLTPSEELPPVPGVESGQRAAWAAARGGVQPDSYVGVTIQGTTQDAVVLTGLTVTVHERLPPISGIYLAEACGDYSPIRFMRIDLDKNPPAVVATGDNRYVVDDPPPGEPREKPITFPYRVTNSEPEIFSLTARSDTCLCRWTATLHWTQGKTKGSTVIDDKGKPFVLTATSNAQRFSAYNGGIPTSDQDEVAD